MNWSDFLPEGEDVQAFISKQVRQSPRGFPATPTSAHLTPGLQQYTFEQLVLPQKLEFTTPGFLNPATTLSKRALSPEEISEYLEKLLLEDGASDEQIFDWVEVWKPVL